MSEEIALYGAIFDPALPQCFHSQNKRPIRILDSQYTTSTILTLLNDFSGRRPAPPHSSIWGHRTC